jgi:hypothetical protein
VLFKRNSLIALCACLVFTQACKRQSDALPDLVLLHDVSPQPPRVGPVTITLKLSDVSGKPLSGAHIRLEGNMSHAGMTPVFAEASETDPGSYRAIMNLSMAGDWDVLVQVTLRDRRKLDQHFDIKGVAPV